MRNTCFDKLSTNGAGAVTPMTALVPLALIGILAGLDLGWGERWSARALIPLGRVIGLAPAAPRSRRERSYGWRIAGTMLAAFSAFVLAFTLIVRAATRGGGAG